MGVLGSLITLTLGIFLLVTGIINAVDLSKINGMYPYYYPKPNLAPLTAAIVFEFIGAALIIIIIFIFWVKARKDFDDSHHASGVRGGVFIYSLVSCVIYGLSLAQVNSAGTSISSPAIIFELLVGIVAVIVIIIGFFVPNTYSDKPKFFTQIIGICLMLIVSGANFVLILAAYPNGSLNAFDYISSVFELIAFVLLIAFNAYWSGEGYIPPTKSYSSTTQSTSNRSFNNYPSYPYYSTKPKSDEPKEPSDAEIAEENLEALKRLKEAYENKIITKKEYDEKRKQYVDKL